MSVLCHVLFDTALESHSGRSNMRVDDKRNDMCVLEAL